LHHIFKNIIYFWKKIVFGYSRQNIKYDGIWKSNFCILTWRGRSYLPILFSFVLNHEFISSPGQIDQRETIVPHFYTVMNQKFVSTNQIFIFITETFYYLVSEITSFVEYSVFSVSYRVNELCKLNTVKYLQWNYVMIYPHYLY
jgi:hypothetical protein